MALASLMVSLGMDTSDMRQGAARAEAALGGIEDRAEQTESALGGMTDTMKTVGAAGGAAAGAALAAGFAANLSFESANAKLQAQLGLTKQQAGQAGKVAGQLFYSGVGESIGAVNEAVRAVVLQMNTDVASVDLKPLTRSAMTLASVFDVEVSEAARAAGQMMKTGLADSGQEAFDILTRGFQTGANRSDDLLDTLEEYPTHFRDLGLSGADAVGLLNQGLDAGAFNADKVADALKELTLRVKALDAEEALKTLGLDARAMARAFSEGGPAARAALDQILDRLRSVRDPAQRARLAVELFGTQAEDMAASLANLNVDTAAKSLGRLEGATKRAGETMAGTAQRNLTMMQRRLQQVTQAAAGLPGPLGAVGATAVLVGPQVLQTVYSLQLFRSASASLVATSATSSAVVTTSWLTAANTAARSAAAQVAASGRVVAGWIAMGTAAMANAVRIAAAWLIALGPVGWVIAAVLAVVGVFALLWWRSEAFRGFWKGLWGDVREIAGDVGAWFAGPFVGFFQMLWRQMVRGWNTFVRFFTHTVASLPGRVLGALGNLGDLLYGAGKALIEGLWRGIQAAWGWVRDKLEWIKSMIPDWKGPLSDDRALLVPAGRAVMDGLLGGIDDRMGALRSRLADVSGRISAAGAPRVPGVSAATRAGTAGGVDTAALTEALVAALSRAELSVASELTVDARTLARAVEQGQLKLAARA